MENGSPPTAKPPQGATERFDDDEDEREWRAPTKNHISLSHPNRKGVGKSICESGTYGVYCARIGFVRRALTENKDMEAEKHAADEARLALIERVKELNCLYALGKLGRADIPLSEILQRSADIVPSGWHFPAIACARIVVEDQEFVSTNFKATPWKISADILVRGECMGCVEVYYLEEKPTRDDGPFVREERKLINDIARHLGGVIEHNRAEKALLESESKYKTLLENLPLKVFYKDTHSVYVSCNENYAHDLHIPAEQIAGKTDYDFHPRKVAEKYMADDKRIMESGNTEELDESYIQEGQERIVHTVKTPVRDERGDVIGVIGIFWDITNLKRTENALRASEEKYRLLFENLNDAAFVGDAETGFVLDANLQAERLIGRTHDEIVGMHQTEVHPPEECEEYKGKFGNHVARGRTVDYDGTVVKKDGTIVPVHISAAPVTIGGRHIILALFRDITDQKLAAEEIEGLAKFPSEDPYPVMRIARDGAILYANAACEQILSNSSHGPDDPACNPWHQWALDALASGSTKQVEVESEGRTFSFAVVPVTDAGYVNLYGADITDRKRAEEQLRQAAKMEAIGRLAAGVAHDFNNYLAAIKGYAALILEDLPAGDDARDDVAQIAQAAEAAIQLTRQLLAFGRRTPVRPQVIDLNRIIAQTAESLNPMLRENIQLAIRQEARPANINADPVQIQQIIINLAINARDAMPQGGLLTIETANVQIDAADAEKCPGAAPGRYVALSVNDTGTGMDEEMLQHVFEPFFTTKPAGEGSGLGLATVHGIVEQSGGHITVESEPGEGTTFRICFPAVDTRDEAADESPAGREAQPPPGGAETILVVEDEEPVRRFVVKALTKSGYTVLDAGEPAEALLVARDYDKAIHLLLSDVVMPGMSGPQLAQKLRPLRPGIPVLYMSGYPRDVFLQRGAPETDLLAKPFSPEELSKAVREALDAAGKRAGARA